MSSSSGDVWVNTVGTFGISSVAVHWSRLMGGLQRAVFYLLRQIAVFILTYVDDNLWLARGSVAVKAIAAALLFLCASGLPIAWRKCHGGLSVGWVGYHLDIQKKLLGIGANKARWLINWIGKALQDDYVVVAEVSSVLGRFSFAFAALEPLRPFLGPLYAWTSAVKERAARLKLPKALRLVLSFLLKMLEEGGNLQ